MTFVDKLNLPFVAWKNQWAGEAERITREIAIQTGVFDSSDPIALKRFKGIIECPAYAYPQAELKNLALCARFTSLLWFIDDTYDEDQAFAKDEERLVNFMLSQWRLFLPGIDAEPETRDPLSRFTILLKNDLLDAAKGGEVWLDRLSKSIYDYLFQGSLKLTQNWVNDITPDLETYLKLREYDSGMYPCLDFVEIANGIFLPDTVVSHPIIQEMRKLCARILGCVNDIFSYEKEVKRNNDPNNLVHVLMQERSLSLGEGVDAAVTLINADIAKFLKLEKAVPKFGNEQLQSQVIQYIEGMKYWMRGNVDWSLATGRYSIPLAA